MGHNGGVRNIAAPVRACAVGVVAVAVVASGCVQTISGSPVKAPGGNSIPNTANVPPLSESQLDHLLLPVRNINVIVGGTDVEVVAAAQNPGDHYAVISDLGCLGAVYAGDERVYAGSGWTAARDAELREPSDTNEHWVEQTAVLYPSAEQAKKFFDTSSDQWRRCTNSAVAIDESGYGDVIFWTLGDVHKAGESVITLDSFQEESDGWTCQHAMGLVSNLIAESFACGRSITDEAEQIVDGIMDNAAAQK